MQPLTPVDIVRGYCEENYCLTFATLPQTCERTHIPSCLLRQHGTMELSNRVGTHRPAKRQKCHRNRLLVQPKYKIDQDIMNFQINFQFLSKQISQTDRKDLDVTVEFRNKMQHCNLLFLTGNWAQSEVSVKCLDVMTTSFTCAVETINGLISNDYVYKSFCLNSWIPSFT